MITAKVFKEIYEDAHLVATLRAEIREEHPGEIERVLTGNIELRRIYGNFSPRSFGNARGFGRPGEIKGTQTHHINYEVQNSVGKPSIFPIVNNNGMIVDYKEGKVEAINRAEEILREEVRGVEKMGRKMFEKHGIPTFKYIESNFLF